MKDREGRFENEHFSPVVGLAVVTGGVGPALVFPISKLARLLPAVAPEAAAPAGAVLC